jgi:spore maturation protein CgeB
MRVALFYQSLLSDWNHANAHFLRGVAMELLLRGHEVVAYEPHDGESLLGLLNAHGHAPIARFHAAYPGLASRRYHLATLDPDHALRAVDLVIVHEWCDAGLLRRLGEHRALGASYHLLYHDTHHRCLTDPGGLAAGSLQHFDGVLAGGSVLRDRYLAEGWNQQVWTWHEAADTRLFQPCAGVTPDADLVWIGGWDGDERLDELTEFLIRPVKRLGLKARVYGAGYSPLAQAALAAAGIEYAGWVPDFELPAVYARHRVALHLPRQSLARLVPGIPTCRTFAPLACGRPLVCAAWDDWDQLFQPGRDFGVARDGDEMVTWLRAVLTQPEVAGSLARHGRRAILARHTCRHRVDQLLQIVAALPRRAAAHWSLRQPEPAGALPLH